MKDPIIRDAWGIMGTRIKYDADEIFGQENFLPVRRDLVNDAIVYRSASITDMWTGQSRVAEPIRNAVKGDCHNRLLGKRIPEFEAHGRGGSGGKMLARSRGLGYRVLTGVNPRLLKN